MGTKHAGNLFLAVKGRPREVGIMVVQKARRKAYTKISSHVGQRSVMIGDKSLNNAQTISKIMNDAGFDTVPVEMDLSSRESIMNLIGEAQKYG